MNYGLALLAVGVFAISIVGWIGMFLFSNKAQYSRKALVRWWRRKRRFYGVSVEKIKSLS